MVPTQYKALYGELSYVNQHFSVEKAIPIDQLSKVQPVSGLHLQDFKGTFVLTDLISMDVIELLRIYGYTSYINQGGPLILSTPACLLAGVIFTYDFHPVMLYMEERREKIIDFISSLFGIVGGVITVLRCCVLCPSFLSITHSNSCVSVISTLLH